MALNSQSLTAPDETLLTRWQDAVSLVEKHLAAMESLNPDEQLALFADNIEIETAFHESGLTGDADLRRRVGIAEVKQWLSGTPALVDVFAQMRFVDTVFRPTADGNSVYVEAKGDCIMADGQSYRNRYVFRYDVSGEKITKILEFCNPVTSARPFGRLLPPGIVAASPTDA